ncbi:MAG: stage V sporulation protein AE [Bacillota bacterium]
MFDGILWAFVMGGAICVLAQLVMDLTKLTPAHVMVLFVSFGAIASGLGLYKPLVELAGAGASVPLPGFGHALVQGALDQVKKDGWVGVVTGGLTATALGITLAVLSGLAMAAVFTPKGR